MNIRFFATFRDLAGTTSCEWPQREATLGSLLNGMAQKYGREFERHLLQNGDIAPWVIVLVNGRDFRHLDGLETPLNPDDQISLFPPVAGG